MPIYAYRCESCGFQKDVLRKMSDPLLTDCPSCGKSTFQKQVTAAGFQLKGSGWYVTDFRDNGNKPSGGAAATGVSGAAESAGATPSGGTESGAATTSDAKPAAAAPAAASTPAPAAAAPASSSGSSAA
jgi:putative FmdB family regulatory protein